MSRETGRGERYAGWDDWRLSDWRKWRSFAPIVLAKRQYKAPITTSSSLAPVELTRAKWWGISNTSSMSEDTEGL